MIRTPFQPQAAPPVTNLRSIDCLSSVTLGIARVMKHAPQRLRHFVVCRVRTGWEVRDGHGASSPVACPEYLPDVMAICAVSGWHVTELRPHWWAWLLGFRPGWEIVLPHWDEVPAWERL